MDFELVDRHVIQLFALVENAVAGATHALVSADREAARNLVAADADIDELYQDLERSVQSRLLDRPSEPRGGPVPPGGAGHAPRARTQRRPRRARRPSRDAKPPRRDARAACAVTCSAWARSPVPCGASPVTPTAATHRRRPTRLESLDDEMDDLHVTFIAELVTAGIPVEVAIELALVGRFYERLGDHAVNLARPGAEPAPPDGVA